MKKTRNIILSALFWLALWTLLALHIGSELLMPTPWAVLRRVAALAVTAEFWRITAVTLLRILCGVIAGIAAGTVLAVLTARFAFLNTLLAPLLTVIKATPVVCFIVLVLLWIGRDLLPAFIVVLMVLPVVWANVSAGIAGTDRQLLELARVYHFPRQRTLRRIYFPAVLPHFLAACRSALGLAWKDGVAAEVLTMPAFSIGRKLAESKSYMEIPDLFAWTVVVVICSLIIEKLLTAAIGRIGGGRT